MTRTGRRSLGTAQEFCGELLLTIGKSPGRGGGRVVSRRKVFSLNPAYCQS